MLNQIKKSLKELENMKSVFSDCDCEGLKNIELLKGNLLDVMQPLLKEHKRKDIYRIVHTSTNNIIINNITIDSTVFEEEKTDYKLEIRVDLIEMIEELIKRASGFDLELMKADIKYLDNLDDNLVFSSISTNEYVTFSDDSCKFNEICEDILELQEALNSKDFKLED